MIIPLVILAIGALAAGYLFKELLIGNNSTFWGESILFLNYIKLENIPIWLIIITPVVIIIAIPLSYYIYVKDKKILDGVKNSNLPLYNFLLNKWYIDEFYDFIFIKPLKKIGKTKICSGVYGGWGAHVNNDQTQPQQPLPSHRTSKPSLNRN